MANWQASLLMQTLSTGSVLVLQRDKTDAGDVPTLHGGDTFYGSLPDGDPFGGTVTERHEGRAVVEVNQKRYHLHKAQPHETTTSRSSSRTNTGSSIKLSSPAKLARCPRSGRRGHASSIKTPPALRATSPLRGEE
jgi:hypothetical protein